MHQKLKHLGLEPGQRRVAAVGLQAPTVRVDEIAFLDAEFVGR
jgi:hypothetical protein